MSEETARQIAVIFGGQAVEIEGQWQVHISGKNGFGGKNMIVISNSHIKAFQTAQGLDITRFTTPSAFIRLPSEIH